MNGGGGIMGEIGLPQDKIIAMLTERGIDSGQPQSAKKLRDAIADIVIENNKEIEKKISEIVAREFSNELKRYGASRRF
jgi:hypothetical protein